ncbi:MAG: hypothetical protein AAGI69_20315 [Cyanobacteria bacterium P01_H01_bin.21]
MTINSPIFPAEQALLDSLTVDQMVLVAKWVASQKELRLDEGNHVHVNENLSGMAYRMQGLAHIKQVRSLMNDSQSG